MFCWSVAFAFLRFTSFNSKKEMMPRATNASPPRTPPTMAPTGVLAFSGVLCVLCVLDAEGVGVADSVDFDKVLFVAVDDVLELEDATGEATVILKPLLGDMPTLAPSA
jgi:hypothetical protein